MQEGESALDAEGEKDQPAAQVYKAIRALEADIIKCQLTRLVIMQQCTGEQQ